MAVLQNVGGISTLTTHHCDAILKDKFPEALQDLENILHYFSISKTEVIAGGGGESSITQRLRRAFEKKGWEKKVIDEQHIVDGIGLAAESHEVDHFKTFENGRIALEIEWNNKDPFYDRDLENFRKLHQIGFIDLGIIVTRGASLQGKLASIFVEHYSQIREIDSIHCTQPQKKRIEKAINQGQSIGQAAGSVLFRDKFGQATTHWAKLMVRVTQRGLGKPCPLLLIGLEEEKIT